jgi:hypothetical protein
LPLDVHDGLDFSQMPAKSLMLVTEL